MVMEREHDMVMRWFKRIGGLGALLAALGIATSPFAQERLPPLQAIDALQQGADTPGRHGGD
jgi:hypothetical protein